MKTPNELKEWLKKPARIARENIFKRQTLEYIGRLETVVAAYTVRDGKMEDKNGHCEH